MFSTRNKADTIKKIELNKIKKMKKIILLLALSVTLFSTAQSTYLIQKPLRLETVNKGEKSDSILVRGTDKIVKFVPRNEFVGSSNLKTVNGISLLGSGDVPFTPVSDSIAGIVNNTPLQELGGVDKTIRGVRIGRGNSTGIDNVVFGINSQNSATTAVENHSFGFEALRDVTTGNYNTAMGWGALQMNTTGNQNSAFGDGASLANTTGSYNVAIGTNALLANQYGSQNVAIGGNALAKNIGTAGSNIFGHRSVAIGASAMYNNTTGHGIGIGNSALNNNTTGTHNIALGLQSGSGITTGSNNTIVAGTGFIALGGGITTGSNNLILAQNNGNTTGITTGSGNTIVGKVSGLAAALANTVIVSDGVGTQRFISDASNLSTLPAQTTALITGDVTGKAVLTKEYLNSFIGTVAPVSATAPGKVGEIRIVAGYIYWCTAPNTWIRASGTTF